MTELMAKQQRLQHSIERSLDNYKKLGRNNLTPARIRSRIASLKDLWMQYQVGHDALTAAVPEERKETTIYFKERHYDSTEDAYQTTLDQMTDDLEELEPVSVNQSMQQSIDHGHPRPEISSLPLNHLPPITLPPFDGKYAEWETFRNRFAALISSNRELTDFTRMHFLVSALKGSALECVAHIPVTADNFAVAWQTLTSRFENKRRLLDTHLSTLLHLPAVASETASDLQSLRDQVTVAVASLNNLDRSSDDLWNDILVHIISQRFDPVTRKAWHLKTSDHDDPPSFSILTRFLSTRIRALEASKPDMPAKPNAKAPASQRVHATTASAKQQSACPLCKSRHYINECPSFLAKSPGQRHEIVKRFHRCFNCLSPHHASPECKSRHSCRLCQKRHHTMLHVDSSSSSSATSATTSSARSSDTLLGDHTSNVNLHNSTTDLSTRAPVLLATAWIQVVGSSGRTAIVRALIDQGSEAIFITEGLAQLLRVKRIPMPISISAVGGTHVGTVRHANRITISPRNSANPSVPATALIFKSLTSYAPKSRSQVALAHYANLPWADVNPTSANPLQVIIGADIYNDIILDGVRKGDKGGPIAQNSIFGWIISGPLTLNSDSDHVHLSHPPAERSSLTISVHHSLQAPSLDVELCRFWEIEELPRRSMLSPDDRRCEEHFRVTYSRDSDGRFIVRLPFKQEPPIDIGHLRRVAEKMLVSLMRKFKSSPALEREYREFLREYEALGHMCRAPASLEPSNPFVYIPHHAVFHESSSTTHLRVVFNASRVTSNGSSLNDYLLLRPKLQRELPAVILQWRHHRYVYTADIVKMYRQIRIDDRDLKYQHILWKSESAAEPADYQLLTVTYGMTCTPFLALRVLQQLVADEGRQFPIASAILRDQIYVDDVLFGDDDIARLRQSRDQLIALLRRGKFEFRKWASNSPVLLHDINPENHGLACNKQLANDESVKVLGTEWNPALDSFQYSISLQDSPAQTKRAILSTIAKLYDPLG